MTNHSNHRLTSTWRLAALVLLVGCSGPVLSSPTVAPATPAATATARPDGLSAKQAETLASLARVDDYPLYTMRYVGPYPRAATELPVVADFRPQALQGSEVDWACSLFAALADPEHRLYGRNFDWRFSPALLLFTDPPDGYASVSMVDIEYFGFRDGSVDLTALPLAERQALLGTPTTPFDGMNAAGLAVSMAAVPQHPVRDRDAMVGGLQHEPGANRRGHGPALRPRPHVPPGTRGAVERPQDYPRVLSANAPVGRCNWGV